MQIVNVLDKKLADELSSMGFTYYIQTNSGRSIYCFIADEGLLSYVGSKYESGKHYYVDKHMMF